jgi:SAM-dependent methyltransferase
MNEYDPIARLYDPWSRSVVEDISFYVEEAGRSGGPVVELGVGTGRVAIPIAAAGIRVIGVDSSRGMLEVAAEQARKAGVDTLLDLRLGDLRDPPVDEQVPLVTCPFRAFLHLQGEGDRPRALHSAYKLLRPGGRLIFDVFTPGDDDIADTHGRWIEREPGIEERALWDTESRVLSLSVRGPSGESTMSLSWTEPERWYALLADTGFELEAVYGWFDRSPFNGGEDTVFIARRPR